MVEHGNLLNATTASRQAFSEPIKNVLLLLSPAFDGSFAGIFWTLAHGGKLVLPQPTGLLDPSQITVLIAEQHISDVICTPALYHSFMAFIHDPNQNLSRMMIGDEVCTDLLVEEHQKLFPHVSLVNIYGPTEATIWASYSVVYDRNTQQRAAQIGIGTAIQHVTLSILDKNLQPCDKGVKGDIYIGGRGIARGYLNRPDLTAQHFITHRFALLEPLSRLYKTGDRGRYLEEGNIDYVGRLDDQIQLQGFRVELIGCFLRMDIIKLTLRNQPTLLDLAKQAQQSGSETETYQRASSLVKIAAIGQIPILKKPLLTFCINTSLQAVAKYFPKLQLNQSLINACKKMATADKTRQFFINVNTLNDFLGKSEASSQAPLLGLPERAIPSYSYPTQVIHYALDIAFHRSNAQKNPCITIAANLRPEFQKRFADKLSSLIEHCI